MSIKELNLENMLRHIRPGALETHCGYLMNLAIAAFRDNGVTLIQMNYMADGVEAKIYLPVERKIYHVQIKEVKP